MTPFPRKKRTSKSLSLYITPRLLCEWKDAGTLPLRSHCAVCIMHGCSERSCASPDDALCQVFAWDVDVLCCRLDFERELFASCMGALSVIATVHAEMQHSCF